MLATVGTDKLCKIWDISNTEAGKLVPKCIAKRDLEQGQLFSVQFYEDIPFVLAAGGQKGELAIWDTEEDKTIKQTFGPLLDESARALKKKADRGLAKDEKEIVNVPEDDGNSSFEDVDSEEERRKLKKAKK